MSRSKMNPKNIEDIIEGDVYQKHFGKDWFIHGTSEDAKKKNKKKTNEIHLSVQLNTDGVRLFKSFKIEIWPVLIFAQFHYS